MIKILKTFIIILLISNSSYAKNINSEDNDEIIIPKENNGFLIVKGNLLEPPIDPENMLFSIVSAAEAEGWYTTKVNKNYAIVKKAQKNWFVAVKINFVKTDYWFEYIDSEGLKANISRNKIHKRYLNQWIPNLDSKITCFYYKSDRCVNKKDLIIIEEQKKKYADTINFIINNNTVIIKE